MLIAHAEVHDAHHDAAQGRLTTPATLCASTITIAETLVGAARAGRADRGAERLADIGIAEIPLPAGSAARLAQLRADTNLPLPDCAVLLAAEQAGAQRVLTFDGRLATAAKALGYAV